MPHQKQQQDSDCLAACSAMALTHLGVNVGYHQLLQLLRVQSFGTSGRNLHRLTLLGVQVIYSEGTLEELTFHLANNFPVIALVRTADLSYWPYSTDHSLLVVGVEEQMIYVNDPAFDKAPLEIPIVEFELAWMSLDYRYGVIMKN